MNEDYGLFSIDRRTRDEQITEVDLQKIYYNDANYRKAHVGHIPNVQSDVIFNDHGFKIELDERTKEQLGETVKTRRIYQLYDRQLDLFEPKWCTESYIEDSQGESRPSFVAQMSMIDQDYIKTRFFTKRLNKEGFYKYFTRRDGEYYVDYIDDVILVEGERQMPLWGLSIKEPWKLILMKAWIKQKRGIKGVLNAEPFEFINCFGLPGYRALAITKQVSFLRASKMSQSAKQAREKRIPLNQLGFTIVGKTRNSEKVREMGLVPNRAAYKIVPIKDNNPSEMAVSRLVDQMPGDEENLFKIHSTIPSFWVGEYSVLSKTKLPKVYNQSVHSINIEKEFLATYFEISNAFSKFYIAPDYSSQVNKGFVTETSLRVRIDGNNPHYFFELELAHGGHININIELPYDSSVRKMEEGVERVRYSPIKYFICRFNDQAETELTKYEFWHGQYMKGYHKSMNSFLEKLVAGRYFIYVKIENEIQNRAKNFSINLVTNAGLQQFRESILISPEEKQAIMQSAFYIHTKKNGLKLYLHRGSKEFLVQVNEKFEEFGFAIINIWVHQKSKGQLCMVVDKEACYANGLVVCKQAHGEKLADPTNKEQNQIKLTALPSRPNTIIFEKISRSKAGAKIHFPPPSCINFFEITVNQPKKE